MARKKPARPAARRAKTKAKPKSAARTAAKKTATKGRKLLRKAVKAASEPVRKAVRRAAGVKAAATKKAKAIVKKATRSAAGIKAAATKRRAAKAIKSAGTTAKAVEASVTAAVTAPKAPASKKPNLDRPRKTVADIHGLPSSLGVAGAATAAQTGRAELKERIRKNTNTSPELTAGDVDADWQSAESSGDEAPGGDNPTPDQDVVDEIGRALGVEYEDDEELQGGEEIADRDRHRWELDPNSADDFDDKE